MWLQMHKQDQHLADAFGLFQLRQCAMCEQHPQPLSAVYCNHGSADKEEEGGRRKRGKKKKKSGSHFNVLAVFNPLTASLFAPQ